MRLHPITQLMLLAALLFLAGDLVWVVSLGKALHASSADAPDMPFAARARYWTWMGAPPLHMAAYVLAALAGAFWIETLARVLDGLKRRNLNLMER